MSNSKTSIQNYINELETCKNCKFFNFDIDIKNLGNIAYIISSCHLTRNWKNCRDGKR